MPRSLWEWHGLQGRAALLAAGQAIVASSLTSWALAHAAAQGSSPGCCWVTLLHDCALWRCPICLRADATSVQHMSWPDMLMPAMLARTWVRRFMTSCCLWSPVGICASCRPSQELFPQQHSSTCGTESLGAPGMPCCLQVVGGQEGCASLAQPHMQPSACSPAGNALQAASVGHGGGLSHPCLATPAAVR